MVIWMELLLAFAWLEPAKHIAFELFERRVASAFEQLVPSCRQANITDGFCRLKFAGNPIHISTLP